MPTAAKQEAEIGLKPKIDEATDQQFSPKRDLIWAENVLFICSY